MTQLVAPSRRGFLGLSLGLVCAPAIIRVAKLMPIKMEVEQEFVITAVASSRNTLLTINQITREAVRLFRNSNSILKEMERDYSMNYKTIQTHGLRIGDKITGLRLN